MFTSALRGLTNPFAPPAEFEKEDDNVNDVETSSPSTSILDDEDPLLPTTNNDVVPESPTSSSSSPPNSFGTSLVNIFKNPKCERLVIFSAFLILLGIAVYHFAVEVNRIFSDDFHLDSLLVSSFNVSKNFPETTWDTELSLTLPEGDFEDLDVRYEAPRIWLYSRDGFVSMTTPSLEYSWDGRKLIMHAVFDGMRKGPSSMKGKGQVVNLGMFMETNAMRTINIHASELELRALVMIDCRDLKIKFDALNSRFGTMVDGVKSCKVHVCPLEPHPLYDGADECTTSSSQFKFLNFLV